MDAKDGVEESENAFLDLIISDEDVEMIAPVHLVTWETLSPHLGLERVNEVALLIFKLLLYITVFEYSHLGNAILKIKS